MSLRILVPAILLGVASTALAQPTTTPETPAAPATPAPELAQPAPAPDQAPPDTATSPAVPAPFEATQEPAAAEPTAPPALVEPAPMVADEPAPPPPPEEGAAEETPPKKLSVGTEGLFQPGALIQAWYQLNKAADTYNTFRIRRAEISLKGDIIPKLVSYAVMIDPARALEQQNTVVGVENSPESDQPEQVTVLQPQGPSAILQDVVATFQSEYVDASIGQFKIPVSWEGYNSSSKLLFAERASIARKYGDHRDIGLRLTKTFKYFSYTAGFFNGAGQNKLDNDNGKEGGLRLEAYPIEGMMIGAVGYATLWETDDKNAKTRWEIDARYEHAPFLIQAEYIRGGDVSKNGAPKVTGQGFYTAVGFYVLDNLQLAARVGHVDPNVDADVDPTKSSSGDDEYWHFEGGVNFYILKNEARLTLNYANYDYQDLKSNNQLTFATQLWF